jgi:hypothetical protein
MRVYSLTKQKQARASKTLQEWKISKAIQSTLFIHLKNK